ncbi:MAG: LysM peptidoglycan-binding domain-containing protein [Oliverpabstia sp.]
MRNNKGIRKCKKRNQGRKVFLIAACILVIVIMIFCSVSAVQANEDKSNSQDKTYKYYTSVYIDRDDTLWGIASEYMTDEYADIYEYMDEVKTINHLTDDQLQYGTVICVPYYSEEFK